MDARSSGLIYPKTDSLSYFFFPGSMGACSEIWLTVLLSVMPCKHDRACRGTAAVVIYLSFLLEGNKQTIGLCVNSYDVNTF